jgi:hypothetical protein
LLLARAGLLKVAECNRAGGLRGSRFRGKTAVATAADLLRECNSRYADEHSLTGQTAEPGFAKGQGIPE